MVHIIYGWHTFGSHGIEQKIVNIYKKNLCEPFGLHFTLRSQNGQTLKRFSISLTINLAKWILIQILRRFVFIWIWSNIWWCFWSIYLFVLINSHLFLKNIQISLLVLFCKKELEIKKVKVYFARFFGLFK